MAEIRGGDKLKAVLARMSAQFNEAHTLKVGFLEGATYEDGTPVAAIAVLQEYGAEINVARHNATVHRIGGKGKFVKKDIATTHTDVMVPAHTITIPPRPFFRNMIADKSKEWPKALALAMKATKGNAGLSLAMLGEGIRGQLKKSIRDFSDPPNAPSTIKKKGFNDPLIDKGTMQNSVDFEVDK